MKPYDNPTPFGRSRETTIVLRADGSFEHEGAAVEHQGMSRAFARWVSIHPADGRFVLENGEDWSYIKVEDTPLFVTALSLEHGELVGSLSNGTLQTIDALYTRKDDHMLVKAQLAGQPVWAKLSRHAAFRLGELASPAPEGLRVGDRIIAVLSAPENT